MNRSVLSTKSLVALLGFFLVAVDCNERRPSTRSAEPSARISAKPAQAAPPPAAQKSPPPAVGARTQDEQNTIQVFDAAAPSTVFVTQKRVVVDYFRGRALEVPSGSGSGFIWDDKGHVVTNYHVIKDARALTVTLHDQASFDAKVVGVEPRKDIAVLRIEAAANKLHPIRVPPKKYQLQVGQKTIAIGNPFGLDQTLTTGIVSALGREVKGIGGVSIRHMIQTDAAINPGNSGGPLLDSSGYLIGMNTMIFSRSGASAGIGFAVPVTAIARVVPQIIETGHAQQVGLGIQIDPAQRLERRANIRGVVVLTVLPGTPAKKAKLSGIQQTRSGIKLGDVIVGIDDEPIEDYDDLYNTLDQHKPGDAVTLKLIRDGEKRSVEIELIVLEE